MGRRNCFPKGDSLLLKGEIDPIRKVKVERIKSLLGTHSLLPHCSTLSAWPLPNSGAETLSPPSPAEENIHSRVVWGHLRFIFPHVAMGQQEPKADACCPQDLQPWLQSALQQVCTKVYH